MKEVVDTIDNLWGRSRIIMKSDTEGPIQALKMFVKDVRNGETILEDVVKGDSASNGKAEKAVRDVQGMIRTWKDAVETSYSIQLESNHILIPWIVRHSGEVITRCRMDSTGRTPYQKLKGKHSSTRMLPFGEKVLFQPVKQASRRKEKIEQVLSTECMLVLIPIRVVAFALHRVAAGRLEAFDG